MERARSGQRARRRVPGALCAGALGLLLAAAAIPVAVADATTPNDLHVGGPGCSDAGPGSVDQPFCTIGAAAAATVPGSTVVVAAGTYAEAVSPPVSGTAGAPIVFTAAPSAVVTVAGGTHGFRLSKRSWITVRGFRVQDTTSNGLYVGYGKGIALEGNRVIRSGTRVSGSTAAGIYLTGTTDSTVTGNTVDDNSASGIYLTNGTTRVTVSSNESMRNAFGWQRNANGIDVRAPGNAIINNRTHDNEDTGIQVYPGADDTLVAGNTSSNNLGFTTTVLTNCDHPSTGHTAGCILGDHGIDSLRVTGSTIVGNTVFGNASAGINLEGIADGTASRAIIRNNISVDNAVRCPNGAGGTTPCPRTLGNIRVDATSQQGTSVDRDVVWLSIPGTMMTWGKTKTATLAEFRTISGQEGTGRQADPLLRAPLQGDLSLKAGSAAVDMADSAVAGQRSTDIDGRPRVDDPATVNTGTGPRAYDDAGAVELQPASPSPSPSASPSLAASPSPSPSLSPSPSPSPSSSPSASPSPVPSASPSLSASPPSPSGLSYVGGMSVPMTSLRTSATLTAPPGTASGDLLVAWLAFGSPVTAISGLSGWTQLPWSPLVDGTNSAVSAYYTVATAEQATVPIAWTGSSKGVLTLIGYRGADPVAPVAASAGAVSDGVRTASIATPSLNAPDASLWALSLTMTRTTTSTSSAITWTADPALVERVDASNVAAASSPWVGVQLADSGGPVTAGTHRYVATASAAETHHESAVLLLRPAGGTP